MMEILVGVNSDSGTEDAVALGDVIHASLGGTLAAANIYPLAYDFVSKARVDAEWRRFLVEESESSVDDGRQRFRDPDSIRRVVHGHRSSGVGLAEVADHRDSRMIVIGSAPGASPGRIQTGSTADQLLHGAPVPVAIAPAGYASWAPDHIQRVVMAYQHQDESRAAVDAVISAFAAADTAVSDNVGLHLLTVVERVSKVFRSRQGNRAADAVMSSVMDQAQRDLDEACARAAAAGVHVTSSISDGDDIVQAIGRFEWDDADVLVIGSKSTGPVRRVFLGDMTYKLVRAAPVPVIVVPRTTGAHPSASSHPDPVRA